MSFSLMKNQFNRLVMLAALGFGACLPLQGMHINTQHLDTQEIHLDYQERSKEQKDQKLHANTYLLDFQTSPLALIPIEPASAPAGKQTVYKGYITEIAKQLQGRKPPKEIAAILKDLKKPITAFKAPKQPTKIDSEEANQIKNDFVQRFENLFRDFNQLKETPNYQKICSSLSIPDDLFVLPATWDWTVVESHDVVKAYYESVESFLHSTLSGFLQEEIKTIRDLNNKLQLFIDFNNIVTAENKANAYLTNFWFPEFDVKDLYGSCANLTKNQNFSAMNVEEFFSTIKTELQKAYAQHLNQFSEEQRRNIESNEYQDLYKKGIAAQGYNTFLRDHNDALEYTMILYKTCLKFRRDHGDLSTLSLETIRRFHSYETLLDFCLNTMISPIYFPNDHLEQLIGLVLLTDKKINTSLYQERIKKHPYGLNTLEYWDKFGLNLKQAIKNLDQDVEGPEAKNIVHKIHASFEERLGAFYLQNRVVDYQVSYLPEIPNILNPMVKQPSNLPLIHKISMESEQKKNLSSSNPAIHVSSASLKVPPRNHYAKRNSIFFKNQGGNPIDDVSNLLVQSTVFSTHKNEDLNYKLQINPQDQLHMFNLNQSISQIGKKDQKSESDSGDEEIFKKDNTVHFEKLGNQMNQIDQKIDQFTHTIEDLKDQLGGAQNATEDTREKWKEVLDVLSENQSQFQNNLSQQQKEFQDSQKSSIDGILDSHQKQLELYQIQAQRFEEQFHELGTQFLSLQQSILANQERDADYLKQLEQMQDNIVEMKAEIGALNQKTDQISSVLKQNFENQNNTLKVLEVQNTRSVNNRDEDQEKINKIMAYLEHFEEQLKVLSEGIQKKKEKDLQDSGGKKSITNTKPFGVYNTQSSYNVNAMNAKN